MAEADAKANPSRHATAASKSSLIGAAVQSKAHMHQKTSKDQGTRRADIDTHGKNGFTSRSISANFGGQQVGRRTERLIPKYITLLLLTIR